MIRTYETSDEGQVLQLFLCVQEATRGLYPDQRIIEHRFGNKDGLKAWLRYGKGQRFVYDQEKALLGHYQIETVTEDPEGAFPGIDTKSLGLIQRLAVAPEVWGEGLGTSLVEDALSRIRDQGLVPSVTCLEHRDHAQAIYRSLGGQECARYVKVTGVPAVSFLFEG